MGVRHYTRKSSKDKIFEAEPSRPRIRTGVFVEHADADPYSPRDAEDRYKLGRGKGNAYIEFEADGSEVDWQKNSLTGEKEYFLRGDVDLSDRDPEGFDNV